MTCHLAGLWISAGQVRGPGSNRLRLVVRPVTVPGDTGCMAGLWLRCPRCKQQFSEPDADGLADALIAHIKQEHGHAPPREHVLARIERHNGRA